MQALWGRLLAGEANKPGAFGRRTLELVATMEKDEARLFTSLCGFTWKIAGVVPLVFDDLVEVYNKAGIDFETLTHLDAIGLVRFGAPTPFSQTKLPKNINVSYYRRRASLEFPADSDNNLNIGYVIFTLAGQQLASIAGSKSNEEFFTYACKVWEAKGYKVTETTA